MLCCIQVVLQINNTNDAFLFDNISEFFLVGGPKLCGRPDITDKEP